MDSTPEWSDLIAEALDERLDSVWTSLVGQITAYDATTCTATIQPLNKFRHVNESGDVVIETIAPMQSVPVVQMYGGAYGFSMPVAVGDLALVIVTSQFAGSTQINGDASDSGHIGLNHNLESGFAIVGFFARQGGKGPKFTDTDGLVLGNAQTGVTIKITPSDVRLGASNASASVLTTADGSSFLLCLAYAIVQSSGNVPGAAALSALYSALTSGGSPPTPSPAPPKWPSGSPNVKATTAP